MLARAVLFDLDGTLVDSLDDLAESMNFVLSGIGLPVHPSSAYRGFVGDGVTMLVRRAAGAAASDESLVARAVSRMREVYGARSAAKTRPYAGIPELLDELDRRGLRKGVLSNKPHDLTVELVGSLLARWRFDPVFGERSGVARKPDPSAALKAARIFGVEPREVLYVGDTPTDLATATAAGMAHVAAAWGFRSETELRAAGAVAVAGTPLQVLDFLTD